MHEAYKKGLIDPELYTEDSSMSAAKRMDKSVARVGVSNGWTADATFDYMLANMCHYQQLKVLMEKVMLLLTQTTTTMDVTNY